MAISITDPSANSLINPPAQPNPIQPLNGGNPPGVMSNWNGQVSECSIEPITGSYRSYGVVSFPVESFRATLSQDVVEHKRPNVPGARVESTGFNPIVFNIKAIFAFGLQRSSVETWSNLYPQVHDQVYDILTDDVSPVLILTTPTGRHFTVKPRNALSEMDPELRNGQIIEFELIQTNEDDGADVTVFAESALGAAESSATIFDQQMLELDPPPPPEIKAISLTKLMQNVRGAIDSTTLFINQVNTVVNSAMYQTNLVKDSITRLKSAGTAGMLNHLERVQSGMLFVVNNTLNKSPNFKINSNTNVPTKGKLAVYIVQSEMTMGNAALVTHNSVEDLIKLNPGISKKPTLPIGTQIVFKNTEGISVSR